MLCDCVRGFFWWGFCGGGEKERCWSRKAEKCSSRKKSGRCREVREENRQEVAKRGKPGYAASMYQEGQANESLPGAGEVAFVDALRRGEDTAYETLVRDYGGRMLAVARRMLGKEDEAQDAVQDAFLQAFKAIDRFEGQSKLSTWLHRIVVNATLMKMRKQKRRHERSIEDLMPRYQDDGHRHDAGPAWTVTAEELATSEEHRQLVRTYIEELPADYREVVMLRDIEQMDTQETAEVLGIKPGAVKTRLHRARQALRELLDPLMRGEASV